ncbi:MAG TPA: prolyl oligopeptidase family serine peptidase, partial [Saprospiraceae bacterium]|nr:prolyl oligopeptidase family serine peptidase [Saprospiraceae bacterium]
MFGTIIENFKRKRLHSSLLLNRVMKILYCLIIFEIPNGHTQIKMSTWDDTVNKYWPQGFEEVDIQSKADGTIQKAVFYRSTHPEPQPLIISLHTWSGDYLQEDPLAEEVRLRNWHYIHPDFRGANNRPEACGSDLVIADLADAIDFAVTSCKVDTGNIHIIGVSGGGYTALMAYLKLSRPIKSCHAWVPISNLIDWYWESIGRKNKYAEDLGKIALEGSGMNWETLKDRSPMNLEVPKHKWQNTSLHLYAGIHDGYTGAVPISHSIDFYNKMVSEIIGNGSDHLVDDKIKSDLIIKRTRPDGGKTDRLFDRVIFLRKEIPGLSLTVFEGGHEMLTGPALTLLPLDEPKFMGKMNILTIGDSNGASEYGWPVQLKKLMPFSNIINVSIAGNTIGFDNLGQEKLN